MLLKMATLATLGYVGYSVYKHVQAGASTGPDNSATHAPAGGPLSSQARIQHGGEPTADWPDFDPK